MWWLAAPVVIWVGKKIYDTVTEDSSPSYSDSNSRSQNAKEEKIEKDNLARKNRTTKALLDWSRQEARQLFDEFLESPSKKISINIPIIEKFSSKRIQGIPSSMAALSVFSAKEIQLKKPSNTRDELYNKIIVLDELERKLKELEKHDIIGHSQDLLHSDNRTGSRNKSNRK